MTGTYAVIGDPIDHSMSPLIHNAAFKELKMDSSYIAYKIGRDELKDGVESIKNALLSGFNVTIPHKVEILKYLDSYDDDCKKVGAANTVSISDGRLSGYNTDMEGFLDPLRERNIDIKDMDVLVLGAGGAARAIVASLARQRVSSITIANRTKSSAKALLELADVQIESIHDAPRLAKSASLIVNATSLGLKNEQSIIPAESMNADQIIYDLVYRPMKTELLREATKAGSIIIYGYEMLLGQACRSFKIWHKIDAPRKVMRRAIVGGF
ncbi:MAG: shikimate dehydrogenase [Cenarchaeum symbiont of Oopsacas minuta]|nr:shikimate dehydrogenase [Cenarchaeum symbiont of Oopsacas minuta]